MKKVVGVDNRKEGYWQKTKRYAGYTSPSYQAFKYGYNLDNHRYKVPKRKEVKIDKLYVKPDTKINEATVEKIVESGKNPKVGVVVDAKGRNIVIQGMNGVVAADRMGKEKVEVMDGKDLPLGKLPQDWKFEWKRYSQLVAEADKEEARKDRRSE